MEQLRILGDDFLEIDRLLLMHAAIYISKYRSYVWKDARYSLHGSLIDLVLTSGNQTNEFVTAINLTNNEIYSYCSKRSFRLFILEKLDQLMENLRPVSEVILAIASAINEGRKT